ncbi:hypothetical protein [Gaiella sp.]|uniref:hypothetical protein n=1 Tax=Gaiella sp. TaxID=2663207 RepID=UPI003267E053
MKRSIIVVALATVLATLVATTAALAGGSRDNTLYRYIGQLQSKTASSVTVTVQNGNHAALRSLIGQPQVQEFATNDKTVFLKWTNGIPTVVGLDDLAPNDYVTVNIRADRGATIAQTKVKPAATVADRGPTWERPTKPLYLFRGTFVSSADGTITITVKGGNRPALKLLIGRPGDQTFTTGPETVFLHWAKRIPTVIDASKLKVGDRIIVRIRAGRGSTLAQVQATPAKRVADREPRASETNQNNQS